MTRTEIQNHMEGYLRSYGIPYTKDVDFSCEAPRMTILYPGYQSVVLEGCLWFYQRSMEARVYYNETVSHWCRNSPHIPQLLRLFNYIHARIWPRCGEGTRGILYTPRLYLSEDGHYDIMLNTAISYNIFAAAPLETEHYITVCCPDLLNELSPAIFGVLGGSMDAEHAIQYVKQHILNE